MKFKYRYHRFIYIPIWYVTGTPPTRVPFWENRLNIMFVVMLKDCFLLCDSLTLLLTYWEDIFGSVLQFWQRFTPIFIDLPQGFVNKLIYRFLSMKELEGVALSQNITYISMYVDVSMGDLPPIFSVDYWVECGPANLSFHYGNQLSCQQVFKGPCHAKRQELTCKSFLRIIRLDPSLRTKG